MKNSKLILVTLSILGLLATSCDPSVESPGSEDASQVTYLPKITLDGDINTVLPCDTETYSDPGAIAEAGGEEIELFTSVSGTYYGGSSVDGADIYSVSYSAYNDDGIPATAFREVVWEPCSGDLVNSIAGVYMCSSLVRSPGYATADIGPIIIKDMGNNVYAVSDAIGGWYEHEYGYGPDYAAKGLTLTANDISANDFTLNNTTATLPWGGTISFSEFTVDAAAGTISVTSEWPIYGYTWEFTLTQI